MLISASRVGPMLGASPHQSPLGLYHELRGELPKQEDSELLAEGREFEAAIAKIAERKFGLKIQYSQVKLESPPLSGTLDFVVLDGDGQFAVLEVKNTLFGHVGEGGWGDPGTDQVPLHYWLQVQTYAHLLRLCLVTPVTAAANYGYIAARLNNGVQLYKVAIDDEVIAKIEAAAREMLDRVRDGNPPDPLSDEDARKRWLVENDKGLEATPVQVEQLRMIQKIRADKKLLEAQESELVLQVLSWAQEAGKVEFNGSTIATLGSDRRFQEEEFRAAHPDIAAQYQKLDTSALAKGNRKLYDQFMRRPANVHEQKRVLRIKELPQ